MRMHRPDPLETTWPSSGRLSKEPPSRPALDVRPLVSRAFGRTDRGKERLTNEDQMLIASPVSTLWTKPKDRVPKPAFSDIEGELYVVADGMGGHPGGAEASALAVEAIEASMLQTLGWLFQLGDVRGPTDMLELMGTALRTADARVCEVAAATPGHEQMGTTATMAYRFGAWLFVAHAGDSRCYLHRGGQLHMITQDHTLVGDMVRRGLLGSEEAEHHELRHIVTNVLGGSVPGVRSEGHRVHLQAFDKVLLCTDGLTQMVSDDEIRDVLDEDLEPRDACDRLVSLANDHGGTDNVTVIVVCFDPPEPFGPSSSN